MAVHQCGGSLRILDQLGDEEWATLASGVGKDAGGHPHAREALRHLGLEISRELAAALRVLALGRYRHAPPEVRVEGAAIEILLGGGDGGLSGHGDITLTCHPIA